MTAQLSVFDTVERHRSKHADQLEALRPVVEDVGERAGSAGFTMDSLKRAAGLPLKSKGRELSWLGAVPRYFGLVRRDGAVMNSQRNEQPLWVLAKYADGARK